MISLFLPIAAVFLQATSSTLDKFILSMRRVRYAHYLVVSFPLIFLVTLVIFVVTGASIPDLAFSGMWPWLLAGSIAVLTVLNVFYYRALDNDLLSTIEPLGMVSKIPTILLAALVFSSERNLAIIIPGIFATGALLWGYAEGYHLRLLKYSKVFFTFKLFVVPFGALLSMKLLEIWNPVSLELVRSGFAAVVMMALYRKSLRTVPVRAMPGLIVTNILTAVAWILFYLSFQRLGITHTILIFTLLPVLVYTFAVIFLKEQLRIKRVIAFGIVLISIAVAELMVR